MNGVKKSMATEKFRFGRIDGMVIEKTTFRTTDGTEFESKEEAIAHEQVNEAYEAYKDAVKKLSIAIAEKLVTADGKPFKFGYQYNYYYIAGPFSTMPAVRELKIDPWKFEIDGRDFGVVQGYSFDGEKCVDVKCNVQDLYTSRRKAWEEVLESLEGKKESIDSYAEQIKSTKL